MTVDKKRSIFDHYRKRLAAAELTAVRDDALICPLCWEEKAYDDLCLEHFVPTSIGGRECVLTCRQCNHNHGAKLDSHLSQFQVVRDAFGGHGTIRERLRVEGDDVAVNIERKRGSTNIYVVGKASNPAKVAAIQQRFEAASVDELKLTLKFEYADKGFQKAVLRAAYLVLFKCLGYEYAGSDIAQTVRRRIYDDTLKHPLLGTLIAEFRSANFPDGEPHLVVPGNVNGVEFFLVIIRVRKATTTLLGAYLPVPRPRCDEFFALMEQASGEHHGETFSIPMESAFT
jgi:hypothetical protein